MRFLCLLFVMWCQASVAHEPSQSVLTLQVDGAHIEGRWDIALRDLEDAIGLDGDGDSAITWGELEARRSAVLEYAAARLSIAADGADCTLGYGQSALDLHGGSPYAVLTVVGQCADAASTLSIDYALMFDIDPTHRALLSVDANGMSTSAVISSDDTRLEFALNELSAWSSFTQFTLEGIWHILEGYDHLVFLGLLLLPAVLRRGENGDARTATWAVLKIVTAFTAAHSLTLGLAAVGVVELPTRAVEAVIAASIVVAGLINLVPRPPTMGAALAFGFGLVHGLGFANALSGLGTSAAGRLVSLSGFNIGVELGQLAVVAVVLPLLLALRRIEPLRQPVLAAASTAFATVGVFWLVERLG